MRRRPGIVHQSTNYTKRRLHWMLRRNGAQIGAEVGVDAGRHAAQLCRRIPGLLLFCVDPWGDYDGNHAGRGNFTSTSDRMGIARHRLHRHHAVLLRTTSTAAAHQIRLGSLDFVFIDGRHYYDNVMEDIITWSRRVKVGGIVCGHDYVSVPHSGVVEAVNDYVRYHNIRTARYTIDYPACWWWIKERDV